MSSKIRCVVIEDELPLREWLIARLREFEEIEIVGEAGSVLKGFDAIAATKPDAVFLDIKITGGNAFSILNRLKEKDIEIPYIVITTGFPDYAAQAINEYSQQVLKYIMKPFVDDYEVKLRDAIDAIELVMHDKKATVIASALDQSDFMFVRNIEGYLRIDFQTIKCIEAIGDGRISVLTDKPSPPIDMTLVKFLNLLPKYIKQVSKSHAININLIENVHRADQTVTIKGYSKPIGIGDKYYGEVLDILGIKK